MSSSKSKKTGQETLASIKARQEATKSASEQAEIDNRVQKCLAHEEALMNEWLDAVDRFQIENGDLDRAAIQWPLGTLYSTSRSAIRTPKGASKEQQELEKRQRSFLNYYFRKRKMAQGDLPSTDTLDNVAERAIEWGEVHAVETNPEELKRKLLESAIERVENDLDVVLGKKSKRVAKPKAKAKTQPKSIAKTRASQRQAKTDNASNGVTVHELVVLQDQQPCDHIKAEPTDMIKGKPDGSRERGTY